MKCATGLMPFPLDRTRVKPIVKITGEFWAQTTEGDGNFNMFKFLRKGRRAGAGGAHRHLDHVHDSPGEAEDSDQQGLDLIRRNVPQVELEGDLRQTTRTLSSAGQTEAWRK